MSPRCPVYLFSISFKKIIIRQKPFFVIIFVSLSYFFSGIVLYFVYISSPNNMSNPQSALTHRTREALVSRATQWLYRRRVKAFYTVVDDVNFKDGASALIQVYY